MGLSISEYDEITPYQLSLHVKVYNENQKVNNEEKISIAYMTALWTAQWFGKNQPKSLTEILGKKAKSKKMTNKQMLQQVKMLNDLFGGEVKRVEK